MNWYWFHLVHLILNANKLVRKTSGNIFLGHLGGWRFHIFSKPWNLPPIPQSFCGPCYNISFKPYVTSKIVLIMTKNRQWLETFVDCFYMDPRRKRCSKSAKNNNKQTTTTTTTATTKHNNDIKITSDASIVNFERISHIIL